MESIVSTSTGNSPAGGKESGLWRRFQNQLGLLPLVGEYYLPEETNNFWYSLGGVLALALGAQFLTGFILTLKYIPDASLAYGIVGGMIHSRFWGIALGFHFYNSFLIFGLVMAHMLRVFICAAYRNDKKGLWFVGVALAILIFAAYVTGESLHWDEVGFAVPWHVSEILQATRLNNLFHYNFSDLLNPASATLKLAQIYAMHVSLISILILFLASLHFYLIRVKGVSLPFWKQRSGKNAAFASHVKLWYVYAAFALGAMLLLAVFIGRDAGIAPQLLPSSPLYQAKHGPGALGYKPSSPISWTHGWNVFVDKHLGVNPDIWGTVIAMLLMLVSLVAIPFVDRSDKEPENAKEAFDWKTRGLAFAFMALFWIVMLIGVIQNAIAGAG